MPFQEEHDVQKILLALKEYDYDRISMLGILEILEDY